MRASTTSPEDIERFLDAARPFWHPVARTADITAEHPYATTLLSEDLVLWRDRQSGRVTVADDLCPHRGTKLSNGTITDDGCLQCPYHLWRFGPDGACTHIPQLPNRSISPKARLTDHAAIDLGGLVWVCLDPEPAVPGPPVVPKAADPGWWLYAGPPPLWRCQAPRMIENFLDVAHFGAIHAANFGNPGVDEVAPHDPVTLTADDGGPAITFEIDYLARYRWAQPVDGTHPVRNIHYRYRCDLPFAAWIETNAEGELPYYTFAAGQPVSIEETRIFWVTSFPNEVTHSPAELDAGNLPFFAEDQTIVEQQRPVWLPLDLTDELQMPFDKVSIAYRRALTDLGFPTIRLPR